MAKDKKQLNCRIKTEYYEQLNQSAGGAGFEYPTSFANAILEAAAKSLAQGVNPLDVLLNAQPVVAPEDVDETLPTVQLGVESEQFLRALVSRMDTVIKANIVVTAESMRHSSDLSDHKIEEMVQELIPDFKLKTRSSNLIASHFSVENAFNVKDKKS